MSGNWYVYLSLDIENSYNSGGYLEEVSKKILQIELKIDLMSIH